MKGLKLVRRWAGEAKELLLPAEDAKAPAALESGERARRAWHALFEDLGANVAAAEVLDLDGGDARMIEYLVDERGAASGVARLTGEARRAARADLDDRDGRVRLLREEDGIESLRAGEFSLILCRRIESVLGLEELEGGLETLYGLLRPGGELLVGVGCAGGGGGGYGVLTPTGWTLLAMRAGFELLGVQRSWADATAQAAVAQTLPNAGDDERQTAFMRMRLVRPYEAWDLQAISEA